MILILVVEQFSLVFYPVTALTMSIDTGGNKNLPKLCLKRLVGLRRKLMGFLQVY